MLPASFPTVYHDYRPVADYDLKQLVEEIAGNATHFHNLSYQDAREALSANLDRVVKWYYAGNLSGYTILRHLVEEEANNKLF